VLVYALDEPGFDVLEYPKSIYVDSYNNWWIGELRTVSRYRDSVLTKYPLPQKFQSTSFNRSFLFTEVAHQRLYVASQQGYLLEFTFDKQGAFQSARPLARLPHVSALALTPDQTLWIGTWKHGLYRLPLTHTQAQPIPIPCTTTQRIGYDHSSYCCFSTICTLEYRWTSYLRHS